MKRITLAAVWTIATAVQAVPAFAQAWVRPEGEGAVTVATQAVVHTGHILTDGSTLPVAESRSAAIYVEVDYAITDRISVTAGIPFVFARFVGPAPAGMRLPDVDACHCWQQGLQDFGFTAHFNLLNRATAVTPSIAVGVPSHGYNYIGEAVVGRRLHELRFAIDAGTRLDVISPRLGVQGRYSYAVVERFLDVANNRSNIAAEVAYRLTDAWSVDGTVLRQVTHGGLRAGTQPPTPPDGYPLGEITTEALFRQHDRLMRDNYWRVGAGMSFALPGAELHVSYVEFVAGSDTHAGRAFTVALGVPFERARP